MSSRFRCPISFTTARLIKADKEGVRGALFSRPWVDLNLSFDATLPVSNDRTRNGMTELKPTLEAGLQFDLHVWRSEDSRIKLLVRVPLREAFTFQAPPRSIGTTLTPGLKLKADDPWDYAGWEGGIYFGPLVRQPPL